MLNIPIMHLLNFLNIPPYHGHVLTTILVEVIAIIFLLLNLHKKYKVKYYDTIKVGSKIIVLNAIMILSLSIVRLFINDFPHTRFYSLLEIIIFGLIGVFIYGFIAYKNKMFDDVFGKDFFKKFKK